MLAIRSLVFNVLFYAVLAAFAVACLPATFMGRPQVQAVARAWSRVSLWMLRVICDLRIELRDFESAPQGGCLIAAKHQSFWEVIVLVGVIEDCAFVLKRELTYIPVFGWYLKAAGMIPVDRGQGRAALKQIIERARQAISAGRQVCIFPEGTRRAPNAPPDYKIGAAFIYADSGAPCIPVAHNSGLFWPRRSFLRRPGVITLQRLPTISPGLSKERFQATLVETIETATNALVAEAVARDPSLAPAPFAPLNPTLRT